MIATVLTAAALLGGQTAFLCFGPDQLNTAPCCTPVDLNLPNLPTISLQGQGICWNSCGLAAQTCVQVDIQAPSFGPDCGHFETPMEVIDCTGVQLLAGDAVMDYTRTWSEVNSAGIEIQVWRFTLKADLAGDFFATPFCPVPTCVPSYPKAFFYGYVDYALECGTANWEHAVVLQHGCDDFIHKPGFSSQPGVFHPTENYAIVAPDTSANPFVPGPVPPLAGPVFGEAMRSADSPLPFACLAEEPIGGGQLDYLASACMCPLSLNFQQTHVGRFAAQGVCGSSFTSLNLWPTLPWYEFTRTSIGRWSTAASYPGPEAVAVGEGLFLYGDVCDTPGTVQQSLDVFYGALTQGGYPVVPDPVQPLTDKFVDMTSNWSNNFPGPVSLPLYGNVMDSNHLVYVNVP